MSRDTEISKFMSLVLRHDPASAGIVLDASGWTDFSVLGAVVQERFGVPSSETARIVAESPKKRFTLDGSRIRAAQGHSVDIELALCPSCPPDVLFHGTKLGAWPSIAAHGLTAQGRNHVHLSADIETARIVARRREGTDLIVKIAAAEMFAAGSSFFQSDNGVWLTQAVPPLHLTILEK